MGDKTWEGKWKVKELSWLWGPVQNTRRGYLFYSWWLKWKTQPSVRHHGAGETLTFGFEEGLCNAWLSLQYEILLFHTHNPFHYGKIRCTKVIKTKRLLSQKRAPTHYGDKNRLHLVYLMPCFSVIGSQHVASVWRCVEGRSKPPWCTEANRFRTAFKSH